MKLYFVDALFIAAGLLATSCFKSGTSPNDSMPKSCIELSDSTFPGSLDEPAYKVLKPNGGEAYHIGDEVKVLVTAKGDSESVLYLSLKVANSFRKIVMPQAPRGNFNARNQCGFSFIIPDSISDGFGKKISLISDSVKVQLAKYNAETFLYDYSDHFFRILPKAE